MALPSLSPTQPTSWSQWAQLNLPSWMGNDDRPWSAFVGLTAIFFADVMSQALELAALARYVDQPESPNDVLPYLGVESQLPQYFGEPNSAYRLRLQKRWTAWKQGCNGTSVPATLTYALGFYPQFVSAVLNFDFGGGGNYLNSMGQPDGSNIPSYPSNKVWPFGFIVSIVLSGPIGTGAEGRSTLINDQQLATIRQIIGQKKPADWRPMEIIITTQPLGNRWDTGSLWDDGVLWDQPGSGTQERYHT